MLRSDLSYLFRTSLDVKEKQKTYRLLEAYTLFNSTIWCKVTCPLCHIKNTAYIYTLYSTNHYSYINLNFLWNLQLETDSSSLIPEASGLLQYRITKDAIGRFISFQCTPIRDDGIVGEPRTCMGQERVRPGIFVLFGSEKYISKCQMILIIIFSHKNDTL